MVRGSLEPCHFPAAQLLPLADAGSSQTRRTDGSGATPTGDGVEAGPAAACTARSNRGPRFGWKTTSWRCSSASGARKTAMRFRFRVSASGPPHSAAEPSHARLRLAGCTSATSSLSPSPPLSSLSSSTSSAKLSTLRNHVALHRYPGHQDHVVGARPGRPLRPAQGHRLHHRL